MDQDKLTEKYNKVSEEAKQKIIEEYTSEKQTFNFSFIINEKPEAYARARFRRTGKFVQVYNPKASIEVKYRNIMKEQLSQDTYDFLKELMNSETAEYYIDISCNFYVPIQQADSAKKIILKEAGVIRPSIRTGDVDNYTKLILDSLHEVIYTDDKIVMGIHSEKYYSLTPRTEITVKLNILRT